MEVYPAPQKCLNEMLDNFGNASTTEGSLNRGAFGDETLKSASHEEVYVIEGFR
jgi:hypothetical protein